MNLRKALDECHEHDFYLVGSQALKTARPDSDWDYVVDAKHGIINFVRSLGFVNVMKGTELIDRIDEDSVYGNNNKYVKAIVQKRCEETGVLVQIAIVEDASMKLKIMEVLGNHPILRELDLRLHRTKARNQLWDALYALVGWQGEAGGRGYTRDKEEEPPKKFSPRVQKSFDEDFDF